MLYDHHDAQFLRWNYLQMMQILVTMVEFLSPLFKSQGQLCQ